MEVGTRDFALLKRGHRTCFDGSQDLTWRCCAKSGGFSLQAERVRGGAWVCLLFQAAARPTGLPTTRPRGSAVRCGSGSIPRRSGWRGRGAAVVDWRRSAMPRSRPALPVTGAVRPPRATDAGAGGEPSGAGQAGLAGARLRATLCRRQKGLHVQIPDRPSTGAPHLLIDSTS